MKSVKRTFILVFVVALILLGVVVGATMFWVNQQHDSEVYVGAYDRYMNSLSSSYKMHSVMDADIVLKVKADEESEEVVQIPMDVVMLYDADIYEENEHGIMDMSMKFLTQDTSYKSEMYIVPDKDDKRLTYVSVISSDSEDREWSKTNDDISVVPHQNLVQKSLFERGVAQDKDGYHYIIGDSSYVLDILRGKSTFVTLLGDFMSDTSLVDEAFDTAAASAKAVYQFDDDYRLVSVVIEDFSYWTEEVSVSMTWTLNFDDFGSFTLDDVAVPSDVSGSASDMTDVNLFAK